MSTSTKQSQAQLNDELILVLLKMGVYMERDRLKLDGMSSTARTTRLRKALDRAVENCCIFPLLFPPKEDREMGKLVLSTLPEWKDWRVARREQVRFRADVPIGERNLRSLGDHSVFAPFRLGQVSVQNSALIQGASVRLKEDIKVMKDILERWGIFATSIDLLGQQTRGAFWGLASTPVYLQQALPRAACIALQPLAVFEVQLHEDIDDADNETNVPEAMAKAGFRGNTNRRAVPIILVRYATALPGMGSQKDVTSLIDFGRMVPAVLPSGSITPTQLKVFSRILESNHRRLSPSEIAKYQKGIPSEIAKCTKISFISPLYCPDTDLADQLEIGRRPRLSCAVCEEEQGPNVKLFNCAACSGVTYCSAAHQSEDWSAHKAACTSKKPKVPTAIRVDTTLPSSPITKILLPLQYSSPDAPHFASKFSNWSNPMRRIKPPRKAYTKPQCSKTIYAHGERFLVRARWGGHADRLFGLDESERQSEEAISEAKARAPNPALDFYLSMIHFIDRPCSVSPFLQKQTGLVGGSMILGPNGSFQAPTDNTPIFNAVVRIIQSKSSEKDKAEAVYFWATRKGDCVEVDLMDLPDQSMGW